MEAQLRQQCRDGLPLITQSMVDSTRAACSRRTGALAESVQADDWIDEGDRFTTTISAGRGLENPDVARFQDEGTGLFGPEGTRILPTTAKVLMFDWPAAGGVVFAKSVAGSPGTHFFEEPMPARYREAAQALWR